MGGCALLAHCRVAHLPFGPNSRAPAETWLAVDSALKEGLRNLPGGTSLAQILVSHRGARDRAHPPALDVEKILAWADATCAHRKMANGALGHYCGSATKLGVQSISLSITARVVCRADRPCHASSRRTRQAQPHEPSPLDHFGHSPMGRCVSRATPQVAEVDQDQFPMPRRNLASRPLRPNGRAAAYPAAHRFRDCSRTSAAFATYSTSIPSPSTKSSPGPTPTTLAQAAGPLVSRVRFRTRLVRTDGGS